MIIILPILVVVTIVCVILALVESYTYDKANDMVVELIDNLDTTHIDINKYTLEFRIYGSHPDQKGIKQFIETELAKANKVALFGINYTVTSTWCDRESYKKFTGIIHNAVEKAFENVKWPSLF